MRRVLLTGAGGGIGRRMRKALANTYPILRSSDMVELEPAMDGEEVVQADLTIQEDLEQIVDGVDGIIHLGGTPEPEAHVLLERRHPTEQAVALERRHAPLDLLDQIRATL